jgi:hypothetical protein
MSVEYSTVYDMTLEVSCIGSISYTYYWGGISYTINKLVEWWVTPVYEVVYSIRNTSPLIVYEIPLIRDTAYMRICLTKKHEKQM